MRKHKKDSLSSFFNIIPKLGKFNTKVSLGFMLSTPYNLEILPNFSKFQILTFLLMKQLLRIHPYGVSCN